MSLSFGIIYFRKIYLSKLSLPDVVCGKGVTHFWQGLVGVNPVFQHFTMRVVGNGAKTRFFGKMNGIQVDPDL